MHSIPSLKSLFGEFFTLIHTLKYRHVVIKFSIIELEINIYYHDSKEALNLVNQSIASLEDIYFNFHELFQELDWKQILDEFKVDYSSKENGIDAIEIAYVLLEDYIKDLSDDFINIQKELQKIISPNIEPEQLKNTYVIGENLKVAEMQKKSPTVLDIRQTALLLHYFKELNIIQNLSNDSLGKLGSYLTGHSSHKLATIQGFGAIHDIIKSPGNLEKLKEVLNKTINLIDKEITNTTKQ